MFYLCLVIKNGKVVRNGVTDGQAKSIVSQNDFPEANYPTYCSGSAYITTPRTMFKVTERIKTVKVFHIDDALVTGVASRGLGISYYDWSYHFLINHIQARDALLDRDGSSKGYFTPELMVAYDLKPEEIRTLYRKSLMCRKHAEQCYHQLWKHGNMKLGKTTIKEEL